MKKFSYKVGIFMGLFLYVCGVVLFWFVVEVMNYILFLIGLFIIVVGFGCLEIVVNLFVIVFGLESGGYFCFNLVQIFNLFGVIIVVVFGQSFILFNVLYQLQEVLDKMMLEQFSVWKYSLVLLV